MLSKRFWWALLAGVAVVGSLGAQELKQVSIGEAAQHVAKRVEPKYPQLAAVAKIEGDVVLRLTVDENGKVTDANVVSGHPILIQPALSAAREWEFNPFVENGKPVVVSALVRLEFRLGPGAERNDYLRQEVECIRQIQNKRFAQASEPCKRALDVAVNLPKGLESDKMRAYGNMGTVTYELKRPGLALEYFKDQLSFAEQALQEGSPQMIQVRSNLAHAYVTTGDLQAADAAYSETEKAQDAASRDLESRRDQMKPEGYSGVKASYDHNMQVILQEHVTLLRKLGKVSEAQTLEERASAIAANK